MARTNVSKNQIRRPYNKADNLALYTKLAEHDTALDALDAFTGGTADAKESVRCATTADHALSGLTAIDGVTPIAGNRIGVIAQSAPAANGIYIAASGAWSRATDASVSAEVTAGMSFFVSEGTVNGNHWFDLTTDDPITLGSTSLTFTKRPQLAELASTASGKGMALLGVQDSAGHLATSTGEAALAEIAGASLARVTPIHNVDSASTGTVADLDAFAVANDGLTMTEGQRVLLKEQTDPSENGIYTLGPVAGGTTAPLTRSLDLSANAQLKAGTIVAVTGGTAGAGTMWQLIGDFPGNIASSHKHFTQVYNATQVTAAGLTIAKRTVTVNDEDAGMTGASYAVNIGAALPANAIVLAHEINIVEQFTGEADTTIIIGGTDTDAIVASTDLDALAIGKYIGTLGVHPVGGFSSQQLVATFAATALEDLSAGQAIITVWYSVLA